MDKIPVNSNCSYSCYGKAFKYMDSVIVKGNSKNGTFAMNFW